MSSEHVFPGKPSSPFLSLFSRKKRVNNTSKPIDELKVSVAGLSINNGYAATENGYIDSELPESCSAYESRNWAQQQQQQQQNVPPYDDFDSKVHFDERNNSNYPPRNVNNHAQIDRTRYFKSIRKSKRGGGTKNNFEDLPPSQPSTLPNRSTNKRLNSTMRREDLLNGQKKSYSADAVYQSDPSYLMEALETLADEQPLVARSIPKHAIVDTSHFAARSLDNCLFDAKVYDSMLNDSLKVCELLQNHLSDCITTVRSKSPAGHLNVLTEESDEETESATYGRSSQQTVIESRKKTDPKRLSTMTNDTTASSIDDTTEFDMPVRTRHRVLFKDP